uniref:blood group Rh(CE) polypeptide isoform X2 n=1 Tax=Callithrix jacchus TaxID=9483 RepID=UPI0004F05B0D|nr:blood group Rh(CE) polypeptide isoform X2 [Callithrix jacchus]
MLSVNPEPEVCQDLTVMAALGLGFLTSSLRRHSWSSVAFNLFMLALGVQWAILLDGFLSQFPPGKLVIKLSSIRLATMSAMSVLISAGAVLGKVNLVQLVVMVLVELTAFVTLRMVSRNVFSAEDHTNMMCIHVFAAYFGLTVAWCLPKPLPKGTEEKERTATCPSLSAMLGTLFLWMFWPSFNSALLRNPIERRDAVFNTYYALVVSAVTSISVSSLAHPQGKINMTYMHNAVLAGGVAVGASCHLISSPWLAMVLGLVAGLISIGGAKCLPVCFNQILGIHDSCGVHYTFGLPGLLGQITYIVLMMHQAVWANAILYQVLLNTGLFSLAMAMGLASGLLTGLLLSLKIWKGPHAAKYFDDQAFWEFPHLAVGF